MSNMPGTQRLHIADVLCRCKTKNVYVPMASRVCLRGIRRAEFALSETSRNGCVFDTAVLMYEGIKSGEGVHDTCEGSFESLVEDDRLLVRLKEFSNHRQAKGIAIVD